MADVRWPGLLRILFAVGTGLVFLFCLLGIVVTGPVVVRPERLSLDIEASPRRLRESVQKLCSNWTPRDYRHVENLDLAAGWIADGFREAGLDVEVQEYRLREGLYRNVIGLRRGTDPTSGARVIGAHYDAYRELPGADDNASGIAVLLELTRTLPASAPRGDQYFVAFSTEEPPFFGSDDMGSYRFAKVLLERDVNVDLMIALDLVGYYSDEPDSQRFPLPGLRWIYPDTGHFIAVVGDLGSGRWLRRTKRTMRATRSLPVYSFRAPASFSGVAWSDHLSFRRLNLPGILVTDTAFLRYPHYHTARDTPEMLDYDRMARLVEALHGVLFDPLRQEPD